MTNCATLELVGYLNQYTKRPVECVDLGFIAVRV